MSTEAEARPAGAAPSRESNALLRAVLIAAPLAAFLALGTAAAGDATLAVDRWLAAKVQAPDGWWLDRLAWLGNGFGSAAVGVPLALALALWLALRGGRVEPAVLIAVAALRLTNAMIKAWFDSPRPTPDLVRITEQADGLGFPSGHAMGTLLLAGAVLWVAGRRWPARPRRWLVAGVCVAAVLVVGFGRVRTGAHWPTDVLGGYLVATAFLAILLPLATAAAGRLAAASRETA